MVTRNLVFGILLSLAPGSTWAQPVAGPAEPGPAQSLPAMTETSTSAPLFATPPPPEASSPLPPRIPLVTLPAPKPIRIVEWIGQTFAVPETTPVLTAPERDAPVLARIRAGMMVDVVGVVDGEAWLQVRLPDRMIGYATASSIPSVLNPSSPVPAPPAALPPSPAAQPLPDPVREDPNPDTAVGAGTLNGIATIFDTATLVLERQVASDRAPETVPVILAGVDGLSGKFATDMNKYLEMNGSWLDCKRVDNARFQCRLRDGTDISEAALVNGAARVTAGAPGDYVVQQESAKAARRGIWSEGEAAVAAMPFSTPSGTLQPGQFVPGVNYAPGGIPPDFAAAAPVDGLGFIDGQPFTLDEGMPAPLVFVPAIGWGFYDRWYKWRPAPRGWVGRLDHFHPRGAGLRDVELERHGFAMRESFFRGPTARATFGSMPRPDFGRSPYPPAFARTISFPSTRMVAGGLPGSGRFVGSTPSPMANTWMHGTAAPTGLTEHGRASFGQSPGHPAFGQAPGSLAPGGAHAFAMVHANAPVPQGPLSPGSHHAVNAAAALAMRTAQPAPPPVNPAAAFAGRTAGTPVAAPGMMMQRPAMPTARFQPGAPVRIAAAPVAVAHPVAAAPHPAVPTQPKPSPPPKK